MCQGWDTDFRGATEPHLFLGPPGISQDWLLPRSLKCVPVFPSWNLYSCGSRKGLFSLAVVDGVSLWRQSCWLASHNSVCVCQEMLEASLECQPQVHHTPGLMSCALWVSVFGSSLLTWVGPVGSDPHVSSFFSDFYLSCDWSHSMPPG